MRSIKYIDAIKEATQEIMRKDPTVILIGEGVPDPKAVFGSTKGLQEEFGPDRVFDMPVSEAGVTGICIGAATQGIKPILVHQRIDFSLYAMDQIVNNAAKWHSMFGAQAGHVPMVVRCIVGRGWGQGNQHSQNLGHLYAMIPGLKVVTPANARDAKEMLHWAVNDKNPVMFIEHRWLHNTTSYVGDNINHQDEIKAKILTEGRDLTLVSYSYMVLEALKASDILRNELDIKIEVVDLRSIRPLDIETIKSSLKITEKLMVLEEAWKFNSLSSEIISQVVEDEAIYLKDRPIRINLPDCYAPSTPHLTKYYYPRTFEIVRKILSYLNVDTKQSKRLLDSLLLEDSRSPHDVPDQSFTGPF